jgi:alpha-tubulin suppressor-like RCC1 family protein
MQVRAHRLALVAGAVAVGLFLSAAAGGSSSRSNITAVTAGYLHTCALTSAGRVECWGANGAGQLGDGTMTDRAKPVAVTGLGGGVVAIAAGGYHTCAVTRIGAVKCWGLNDGGQLGNGTFIDSSTPVGVRGLASGVTSIAAGAGWNCALTKAGGVRCWGWNAYGQLGIGPNEDSRDTPVAVKGLASGVAEIRANNLHACALVATGHVKCWGSISTGDFHAPTDTDVPVGVSGLGGTATAIGVGGLDACAITRGGQVKCWGSNRRGALGNGSKTDSKSPVPVSTLTRGVAALASGSTTDYLPSHTCALTRAGAVRCWGPNHDGQLGNGSTTDSARPVAVSGLSGIVAVTVGGAHTCAITTDRRVKCWGDDEKGQLGDGSLKNSPTPVDVGIS